MVHRAIDNADQRALESDRYFSMRDGLTGMLIGRISNFNDLNLIRKLHIDTGKIKQFYVLDHLTSSFIDTEEAFEKALAIKNSESAVMIFAFDSNRYAHEVISKYAG